MHICLPADESIKEVTHELQDDAYGLVIAADGNHRVWRGAFPGGQGDPVVGQDISCPLENEACGTERRLPRSWCGPMEVFSLDSSQVPLPFFPARAPSPWISSSLISDDEVQSRINTQRQAMSGVQNITLRFVLLAATISTLLACSTLSADIKILRKQAMAGDLESQCKLGVMYANGEGAPQDYAEAVKWYRKAAEQGYAAAQYNLGFAYFKGQGVPQDYAEAVKWYRKAVEQGHAVAQYNLGFAYFEGQAVPQDYLEAAKWYRLAAGQGLADAQYNLGVMYATGQGVPQDYAESAKWYRKAAEQGDAGAQYNLGFMYINGSGVPQDFVQSYFWFSLATSRTSGDAHKLASEARDLAGNKLTPDKLNEATGMISGWEKLHLMK
jgi:TPR repeat protein